MFHSHHVMTLFLTQFCVHAIDGHYLHCVVGLFHAKNEERVLLSFPLIALEYPMSSSISG